MCEITYVRWLCSINEDLFSTGEWSDLKMTFFPARIFFGVATNYKTKRLGSPVEKSCINLYQIKKKIQFFFSVLGHVRISEPSQPGFQFGRVVSLLFRCLSLLHASFNFYSFFRRFIYFLYLGVGVRVRCHYWASDSMWF